MHGIGIDRIMTGALFRTCDPEIGDSDIPSVKTSDQACPRYMLEVLMQNSGGPPTPYQFIEIGQHWNRLAKKNATVHALQIPIIVQTATLNGAPLKILSNL